jgi:hypothetical protein
MQPHKVVEVLEAPAPSRQRPRQLDAIRVRKLADRVRAHRPLKVNMQLDDRAPSVDRAPAISSIGVGDLLYRSARLSMRLRAQPCPPDLCTPAVNSFKHA